MSYIQAADNSTKMERKSPKLTITYQGVLGPNSTLPLALARILRDEGDFSVFLSELVLTVPGAVIIIVIVVVLVIVVEVPVDRDVNVLGVPCKGTGGRTCGLGVVDTSGSGRVREEEKAGVGVSEKVKAQ